MGNGQKIPGLDRVEKYLSPLKRPQKLEAPQWITKTFFLKLLLLQASGPSLFPEGNGLVTNYVRCCQRAVPTPPPNHHPSSSVFRDEIISFGANYRWRTLEMCKENSLEPFLPPSQAVPCRDGQEQEAGCLVPSSISGFVKAMHS